MTRTVRSEYREEIRTKNKIILGLSLVIVFVSSFGVVYGTLMNKQYDRLKEEIYNSKSIIELQESVGKTIN